MGDIVRPNLFPGQGHRVVQAGHTFRYAYARDLAVRAARAGWLGRMARRYGLFASLDDIWDRQEEVELGIYRAHHATATSTASPLALDMLAHWGMDADDLARDLRPRAEWRRWVCGEAPPASGSFGRWSMGAARSRPEDVHEVDAFLHGCIVVRGWDDPLGALGVRLSAAGLEIGARLGDAHLRTIAGEAALTVAATVPDAVKIGAIGRRVDKVFDHPMFRGRPYVIAWSGDYEGDSALASDALPWRVRFRADPVAWRVPWAR